MESLLTSSRNRNLLLLGLTGLIFVCGGIFFFKSANVGSTKVEVLNAETDSNVPKNITVEISGEVVTPGVYKLPDGSRINDLLISAGGLKGTADRVWTDKYLNRAAKVIDGQKVYIPKIGEQTNPSSANKGGGDQSASPPFSSDSSGFVNINTASLSELDSLPGIGQVYGQSIIEHRPYSTTQELVSKGAIKQSLYDKIKDKVSVF